MVNCCDLVIIGVFFKLNVMIKLECYVFFIYILLLWMKIVKIVR